MHISGSRRKDYLRWCPGYLYCRIRRASDQKSISESVWKLMDTLTAISFPLPGGFRTYTCWNVRPPGVHYKGRSSGELLPFMLSIPIINACSIIYLPRVITWKLLSHNTADRIPLSILAFSTLTGATFSGCSSVLIAFKSEWVNTICSFTR